MGSMSTGVAPAGSITHQHIVAIINTLLGPLPSNDTIRILDLGCGTGELLAHMLSALNTLRQGLQVEVFGLDVSDAGQHDSGYFDQTKRDLARQCPGVDWNERLSQITTRDEWPYPERAFDFITSNQVMEHVADHAFVFRQINRCLQPRGVSVNLFPVREVLWEGHASMPLVHRVRSVNSRARLMLLFTRMGFRRHYHREMVRRGWRSHDEFARVFSSVLETDTNYLSTRQLIRVAKQADLRISFVYTKDFFAAKALSYLERRPYRYRDLGPLESIGFFFGKRISSVTVLLRKV
jgi:SAM-dependent methyltransferase